MPLVELAQYTPQTPLPRAMMNEVHSQEMTTAQRMEKQFFINFITLINEVQGKSKLPSQINSNRKSAWVKQTQNPKQKKDALSRVWFLTHTNTNTMFIKYTFDIQTKQPVYAVCDSVTQQCVMITTSIMTAINKVNSKWTLFSLTMRLNLFSIV